MQVFGGTQALFSVVPSRGLSHCFAVGVSRTCTRLTRRVVSLSGAEQKSSHSIAVGVSRTCTRLTRRVVSLSGAEQKSSHSIAVGVSRTCTRLTRRVVSQSPRFACLHI